MLIEIRRRASPYDLCRTSCSINHLLIKGGLILRGFTLLELVTVIIIIGILVTIGISQFYPLREQAIEKEAIANLKLIAAAEKIYRMEMGRYVNASNTTEVNNLLKLSLPTTNHWDYNVTNATNTSFTGQARRSTNTNLRWCINQTTDEPYRCP